MKKLIFFAIILFVQVSFAQNYMDSVVVGYSQLDTLISRPNTAGAVDDSISQFGITSRFSQVDVIVKDIPDAHVDSLVIEVRDRWGNWQQVAGKSLYDFTNVTTIVPGDGNERRYTVLCFNEYGSNFRIRRTNTSIPDGSKTIIRWVGK